MGLEACIYCHKLFRFDRIAKHETRCTAAKPKPSKFDVARNVLRGACGTSALGCVLSLGHSRELSFEVQWANATFQK